LPERPGGTRCLYADKLRPQILQSADDAEPQVASFSPVLLTMTAPAFRRLTPGDPFPRVRQQSTSSPMYTFDTVGGRYIVMCFFGSAAAEAGARRVAVAAEHRDLFDDDRCAFFGVSVDPTDQATARIEESLPGVRHFWDFDRSVSQLCGALASEGGSVDEAYRPLWLVLNPDLRVRMVMPFKADLSDCEEIIAALKALPPVNSFGGMEMHAPVLLIPDVFERALCDELIADYARLGGEPSGFMRDVDGKTTLIRDAVHKVRRDHLVEDKTLRRQIDVRIHRRVASAIKQFFSFEATRMERYLVACYDGADGGHFRPHRDNTTLGTAHRRFALTLNLNEDFDGGDLVFPGYGTRRYRPPPGFAIVFPCSLLHAVDAMRSGQRYAFLPFLYDEAAATVREANSQYLADERQRYKAR
jgi:predicted 2-oxoglutarate/Fe(II)-dependent dioxygenase YbiX/peroxiredoxin